MQGEIPQQLVLLEEILALTSNRGSSNKCVLFVLKGAVGNI